MGGVEVDTKVGECDKISTCGTDNGELTLAGDDVE